MLRWLRRRTIAPSALLAVPVTDRDHSQGSLSAPVTLVEYGDYQCPFAGMAHEVVKRLQESLGDDLRFVYRHFPVPSKHPQAFGAAQAAEAAASQGKFWEYHDLLYNDQRSLRLNDLLWHARNLGLDEAAFHRDLEDARGRQRVEEDKQGGMSSGVTGTPTFFVNGRGYGGVVEFRDMYEALLGEIR